MFRDDVRQALVILKPLGSNIRILSIGKTEYLQSLSDELDLDAQKALELAQVN